MKNTEVPAGASAGIQGLNENGYVGGTRIWKKITRGGSVVEHRVHIHAGPNLIAEYNAGVAASTPVQEYVYGGEIDSLVMIRRSDATKYGVTRNRQWSITALHDLANGNVVERYAYEMTGKRTIYAANGTTVRTTSSFGNHFGYTNRWHDEESGLMYFRARYYNPLTGEFLSRDPLEFVDGMSMYRGYMRLDDVDPEGTVVWAPILAWAGRYATVELGKRVLFGAAVGLITERILAAIPSFSEIEWGQVVGEEVFSEWSKHWNDKGAGNGQKFVGDSEPTCQSLAGSGSVMYSVWYTGLFSSTQVVLTLDYKTDGCSITSMQLRVNRPSNSIQMHSMKMAITASETIDAGFSKPCSLESRTSCGCALACKPKCLDILIRTSIWWAGYLYDESSAEPRQIKFQICADVVRNPVQTLMSTDGTWVNLTEKRKQEEDAKKRNDELRYRDLGCPNAAIG
jgi:RHS repeat-associated protein